MVGVDRFRNMLRIAKDRYRHALDRDGSWRRFVEGAGARTLDSGTDWTRYELPQHPREPRPAPAGTPVRVAHADANVNPADVNAMFDGDLKTRWHAAHRNGAETVTVDFGIARPIRWLMMCLGTYASHYPRSLVVDASTDGVSWTTIWSGRTALAACDAAIADPRAIPIPVRFDRDARLVRRRQTAAEPTRVWTIVELRILE